jgi:hypothetical protein
LSGAAIGVLLLGFATGFQWDDQSTSDNWRGFGLLAAVLVLPCVANSLLGVCVKRKLARRETLLLLASFWLIPFFFAPIFVSLGLFLLPAMAVWTSGLVGISVTTKCDTELAKPSESCPSVASE